MTLAAQASTWLPKGVLNYLTAFNISSYGPCCPLPNPYREKKARTAMRKIPIDDRDNTLISVIKMHQTGKAKCG